MEALNSNQTIRSVFNIMKVTFGLVPIIAGADKFTNLLTHWEGYLSPSIIGMLPFTPHVFMMIVGVVEMIAGLIVLAKPSVGGYLVGAWLTIIAVTLVAGGEFYDVAVRDLVMAISAFSLARIARVVS